MDRAARGRGLQDRPAAAGLRRAERDRVHAGRRPLSGADPAAGPGEAAPVWLDGGLRRDAEAAAAADRALARPGTITTTRVVAGRPAFVARHVARLRRDAAGLGLAPPATEDVARVLDALSRAAFGSGGGVVRIQAGEDGSGRPTLVGTVRPLGDEPATWRALVAPFAHPGPGTPPGAKLAERPVWTRARALRAEHGVDEVLLFDGNGRLVEGARSNLLAVIDGVAIHPDAGLGAVAGVGLSVLCEAVPALRPGPIDADALAAASEVIAVNAVRGPCPVVRIDDRAVGTGRPGPTATRLAEAFAAALAADLQSPRRASR